MPDTTVVPDVLTAAEVDAVLNLEEMSSIAIANATPNVDVVNAVAAPTASASATRMRAAGGMLNFPFDEATQTPLPVSTSAVVAETSTSTSAAVVPATRAGADAITSAVTTKSNNKKSATASNTNTNIIGQPPPLDVVPPQIFIEQRRAGVQRERVQALR